MKKYMKVLPETIYHWWIIKVCIWRMEFAGYFAKLFLLRVGRLYIGWRIVDTTEIDIEGE